MNFTKSCFKAALSRLVIFAGTGFVMAFGNVPQANAQTYTFNGWQPNAYQYDNGFNPSIAISGSTVVEVHNASSGVGPLWYHIGQLVNGTVQWQPNAYQYDNGFNPSIAISGSTVVEVHNSASGVGPLWYHTGQLVNGTIQWQPHPYQYDNGFNPSIAISGSTVVEAHNSASGVGPLWYHIGQVVNGTVQWQPNAHQYDNGFNPSIAISNTFSREYLNSPTITSMLIVEVHNATSGVGPLWYHVGELVNGTIQWQPQPYQYDVGWNPKVAFTDGLSNLIEVHNGTSGDLWYHTASFGTLATDSLGWSQSLEYDHGYNASVASNGSSTIVQVHNANDGEGPLWYHSATFLIHPIP